MSDLIPAWVDGTLTPVEKLRVHQLGLRHLAVSVFIRQGQKILMQRRALTKYHTPGLWTNTCCTHPHWGEATDACASRRLAEELGITGVHLRKTGQVEYRADVGGGLIEHELVDIFVADATADLSVTPNPTEVMETHWADLPELTADTQTQPDRYTPWLRIYLAQHKDQIFGVAS